jgi:NAD(P)-dependent dehydrogenase (short-subunit alcohol dehydrogenase family)
MKSSTIFLASAIVVALAMLLGYPQPTLDFEKDIMPVARARMSLEPTDPTTTPLKGLVVAITGATSGIGRSLTIALVNMGATVVAIGRSERKLTELQESVQQQKTAELLVTVMADLSDLKAVSKASDEIERKFNHIDVLVNNAGMHYRWSTFSHPLSPQGYDLSFATNYLSHFLLTERMIPLLRKSARPSIVQVSSSFHWAVDGSDLMPQEGGPIASQKGGTKLAFWRDQRAYSNAKLAQVLHMRALQREYPDIHSVSVCPGWVGTHIAGRPGDLFHFILNSLAFPVDGFGLNSLLHAVLQTEYENDKDHHDGDFYYNTRFVATVFAKVPKALMSPSFYVLGIRDTIMFVLAATMLIAQKFTPEAHTYQSSPESYNVELQDALYRWSRTAIAESM